MFPRYSYGFITKKIPIKTKYVATVFQPGQFQQNRRKHVMV